MSPAARPGSEPAGFFKSPQEEKPQAPADGIPYAEAQRLLALYRDQGPDALSAQQHEDIWDCLLAQPADQAVLTDMLAQCQTEMAGQVKAPARQPPG